MEELLQEVNMNFKWHRRFFGAFLILAITSLFAAFYACDDFGLDPDFFPGIVKGQLRLSQVPPEKTDELQVYLIKEFPPRNAADLLEASTARILNFSREDSTQLVPFEIEVDALDEFGALIAVWKRVTDSEQAGVVDPFINTIGGHCNEQNEFIKINLTESQPVVEGIIIDVDLEKVNRTSRVSGTINFTGSWPEDLSNLVLVFSSSLNINLCNPPELRLLATQPTDSLNYDFPISPGAKIAILVWIKTGDAILDFRLLGFAAVNPTEETPALNVDINADFGTPMSF